MTEPHRQSRPARVAAVCLALCAAILVATPLLAQTPQSFEEYGVGPKDSAMGAAFTAVADDWSAAFHNPAGLVQPPGNHVTIGWKYIAPRVTAKMPGFGKDRFTQYPDTTYGMFGFTSDLQMPKILNPKITRPFAFGVAIAISEFLHSYTNYYDPYTPYFFRYNDRPVALLSLYLGFGIRLAKWVSIGGGFVVAPSFTYADAYVVTDVYLPEGDFDAKQGIVNRAYGVLDPLAGILFRIPILGLADRLRVGVVWRDEVNVIDGKGTALNRTLVHPPGTDKILEPLPPLDVPVDNLSGFSPMQVALGLAARFTNGLTVSTDTVWKRWSTWENYFLYEPDPPFSDTFIQRVGIEHAWRPAPKWVESFSLRGGWYYEPSPVADQDGRWNILDNDKHVMAAGFGLSIGEVLGIIRTPVPIEAGYQAHYLEPRTIHNGNDPAFPKIETGGWVHAVSVTVEFQW